MRAKFQSRPNPHLYEINAAAWLFELSNSVGKPVSLGDVPSTEWDKIKDLGMDFVWLMGIWSRSQEGRKVCLNDPGFHRLFTSVLPECRPEDIIGSCFSMCSYEIDPLVGTWEDLDKVRTELHDRHMGLILDFIPNHTGIDHHWLRESPEFFVQVTEAAYLKDKISFFPVESGGKTLYIAHGRDPNFPAWTDTAQLNYFNPATRTAMIDLLKKIAGHCDGVRCDMAMLALNETFTRIWGWTNRKPAYPQPEEEFWTRAIREVPDLIYLAEAYWDTEWTLQQLGFDYVYDKRLYDRLRNGHPWDVYGHLTADLNYQKKLLRFIENHDEMRSLTTFGPEKVKTVATLFSGLPGMKLFFHGQLEGKKLRLPLQIRQTVPESVDPGIRDFYRKLLPIVDEAIFHDGDWQLKETFPYGDDPAGNTIAYVWKMGNQIMLIISNLSPSQSQGRVVFQEDISELTEYIVIDRFNRQSYVINGKVMAHPGLNFVLNGYESQIIEIRPIS